MMIFTNMWLITVTPMLHGCTEQKGRESQKAERTKTQSMAEGEASSISQLRYDQTNNALFSQNDFETWGLDGIWESDSLYVRGTYIFVMKGKHLVLETPTQGLERPKASFFGGLSPSKDRLVLSRSTPNGPPSISVINLVQKNRGQLTGHIQLSTGEGKPPTPVLFVRKINATP